MISRIEEPPTTNATAESLLDDCLSIRPKTKHVRGSCIFEQPDGLYYVAEGSVQIYRPEGGINRHSWTHLYLVPAGQYFGEVSGSQMVATAFQDCVLMQWEYRDLESAMNKSEETAFSFGRALALLNQRRIRQLTERVGTLNLFIPGRIVAALIELGSTVGSKREDEAYVIPSWVTHQQISDMVGTSREIVTAVLNKWKRYGLIGTFQERPDRRRPSMVVYAGPLLDSLDCRRKEAA